MEKPLHITEIILQPGELYFGDRNIRVRTLLGSCVAVTMWHPDLLVGGMCHYMLPSRRARSGKALDGKYADEALELLLNETRQTGARAGDYQFKLFGGGNMFPVTSTSPEHPVGLKNVEAGYALFKRHGLKISAEHLGGVGHRTLIFDIWNGDVWMRHQPATYSSCDNCEAKEICPSE